MDDERDAEFGDTGISVDAIRNSGGEEECRAKRVIETPAATARTAW